MRSKGRLKTWNDERGFGFIAPMEGGPDVFAHIADFPRDGRRPEVGDVLTYEPVAGKDGRPRATAILRSGRSGSAPRAMASRRVASPRPSVMLSLVVIVVSVGVVGWEYRRYSARAAIEEAEAAAAPSAVRARNGVDDSGNACDGRTRCSEMRSCEEATWFLDHCPGVQMDGDGDGVPCEQQWCSQ